MDKDMAGQFVRPRMLPMEEAPKDGQRILVKCKVKVYNSSTVEYNHIGWTWLDVFWDPHEVRNWLDEEGVFRDECGWWRVWCGRKRSRTTAGVPDPAGWIPLPEGEDLYGTLGVRG